MTIYKPHANFVTHSCLYIQNEKKNMKISIWMRWFGAFFMIFAMMAAQANESEISSAARRLLGLQTTSVRESLIPGFYGINTSPSEVGPRLFMDGNLTVYGNFSTGYAHLSGPHAGQDLNSQEARELFLSMLAALPKDRLITYKFGDGSRQVLLFTAYDCPACRSVEKALQQQGQRLNATVYLIPTSLRYETNPSARAPVQNLVCATDRETAWQNLILKGQAVPGGRCSERADDYAYLYRVFPVKFPRTVPTAVTLSDGKIYQGVQQQFSEIFGGR